jgi:hypothetical protein
MENTLSELQEIRHELAADSGDRSSNTAHNIYSLKIFVTKA